MSKVPITDDVRIVLSLGHRQDGGVISHADDGFLPIVTVRTGPVTTTCATFRAIETAAHAWASAQHRARSVFPDGYRSAPKMVDPQAVEDVSVFVKACEDQSFTVRHADAAESADGRPYVSVLVGPVLIRALDKASVDSIGHAWRTAYQLAQVLFPGHGPNPAIPPPRFYD
jgi:hypothetical protein